jgi:hypothetical protein
MYYNLMGKDMESIFQVLQSMQERDDDIYRVIFGVNPLADEIRTGGTGGANKYRALMEKGLSREALIVNDLQKIDALKSRCTYKPSLMMKSLNWPKTKKIF